MDIYDEPNDGYDDAPDAVFDAELDSVITDLRNGAHLQLDPQWTIYDSANPNDSQHLQNALQYLGNLRATWRPADGILTAPASWFHYDIDPRILQFTQTILSYLKPAQSGPSSDDDLVSSIAMQVWNNSGQAHTIHDAITGSFTSIPSCQVSYRQAIFRFSPHFLQTENPSSWAVVFNEVEPTRNTTRMRATNLPATLIHPALLVGIKSAYPTPESSPLNDLAKLVQPNLESLLIAFHQQLTQSSNSNPLPPELVLFGLYCTSSAVHVVAHVPDIDPTTNLYRFFAVDVDEIPFPSTESDTLAVMRIVTAVLTLRTHIAHLQTLMDEIQWPHVLTDWNTIVTEQMTGISTPTPSVLTDFNDIDGEGYVDLGNAELESEDPAYDEDTVIKSREVVGAWLNGTS